MALVRDGILVPTKDAPELAYVVESTKEEYVPDVFFKVKLLNMIRSIGKKWMIVKTFNFSRRKMNMGMRSPRLADPFPWSTSWWTCPSVPPSHLCRLSPCSKGTRNTSPWRTECWSPVCRTSTRLLSTWTSSDLRSFYWPYLTSTSWSSWLKMRSCLWG